MIRLHAPFKFGLPILAALLLGTSAQAFPDFLLRRDFVRTIEKAFPLDANGTVDLSNRYGSIDVIPWDKEEVAIEVRIEVEANNDEEAQEIFDRIKINFSNSSTLVSASTDIGTQDKSWWDRIWNWDWDWNNGSNNFKIRYRVQVPRRAALETEMAYGDVNVRPIAGKVTAKVSYGDLRLDEVTNSARVDVSYGKGSLGKIQGRLEAEVRYGEMTVDQSGDTEMDTRYSEIRLTKTGNLRIDSRYDDYTVGSADRVEVDAGYTDMRFTEVGSINGDSNYSDYRIQRVKSKADIDSNYGDVEIEAVSKGFTEIRLRGSYADFEVRVDSGVGYTMNAETSYGDISYPSNLVTSVIDTEGNSQEIRGTVNGGGGLIEARLSYGDFEVR